MLVGGGLWVGEGSVGGAAIGLFAGNGDVAVMVADSGVVGRPAGSVGVGTLLSGLTGGDWGASSNGFWAGGDVGVDRRVEVAL